MYCDGLDGMCDEIDRQVNIDCVVAGLKWESTVGTDNQVDVDGESDMRWGRMDKQQLPFVFFKGSSSRNVLAKFYTCYE